MKKLLLPLLALVFLISCEKESTTNLQPEEQSYENDALTTRSSNKRDVCHNGHIININVHAIPAHKAHGDAVDMDKDGYFDIANDCGMPVDCDDTDDELTDNCSTSCVEGELEVVLPDGNTLYVYPVDNSSFIKWSNTFSYTGATDDWDGDANTDAIVMDQGAGTSYAAGLCASLTDGGCDWYLPSKNELNAMYEKFGQGGTSGNNEMANRFYWSSTEFSVIRAWWQNFNDGNQNFDSKFNLFRCRCVRR